MNISYLHGFDLTPSEAIKLQSELAPIVERTNKLKRVRLIAGVDVSLGRQGGEGRAAIVVIEYPSLRIVSQSIYTDIVRMPYIPGLLSFREMPLILPALEALSIEPDLMIVDGQGIAHPRRLGLAAHLGLFTNIPTIGCAKSRLCGEHTEVGIEQGNHVDLLDDNQVIGSVVRTKTNTKPVYVSIGNMISLETAIEWVLKLNKGYRITEPVRQAHLAAGRKSAQANG